MQTSQHALCLRIAARYKKATEFSSPEELRDYLKEHPGADRSLHHVKKPEAKPKKKEDKPKPKPKKTEDKGSDPELTQTEEDVGDETEEEEAKEEEEEKVFEEHDFSKPREVAKIYHHRLRDLGSKAKSFLSNLPTEIKSFISDDAHRRGVLQKAHKVLENMPDYLYKNAKDAVHKESHDIHYAGKGIKAVLSGKKMTKAEKAAFKSVSRDVMFTLSSAMLSGGVAWGAKALVSHVAKEYVSGLAQNIVTNTLSMGMDQVTILDDLNKFGQGVHYTAKALLGLFRMVTAAEETKDSSKKPDEAGLIVAFCAKLLADQLKNFDPNILLDVLEKQADKGDGDKKGG